MLCGDQEPLRVRRWACSMFHVKHLIDSFDLSPGCVREACARADVTVSSEQAEALVKHAGLVLEANTRMNLTRITTTEEVISLHVVDSVAFLPLVAPLVGRVVDIGAGAGYPGIPLAIVGADVTLCESVKKKAAFLESAVDEIGLSCVVEPVRAEELATARPASADVVVARAVSSIAALVELAAPLLRSGGRLIALKGVPNDDERARGIAASAMCGLSEQSFIRYGLPSGECRTVVVFEKTGRPRISLPRRPGTAQRQPLG